MGRQSRIVPLACLLLLGWVTTALGAKIDFELQRVLDRLHFSL